MLVDRSNTETHLEPEEHGDERLKLPDDLTESRDSGLDTSGSVNGSCFCTKLEERLEKLKEEMTFKDVMIAALQESNHNLRLRAAALENKVTNLRIMCETHCTCCSHTLPTHDKAGKLEEASERNDGSSEPLVNGTWGMRTLPLSNSPSDKDSSPKLLNGRVKERRAAFSSTGRRKEIVEEDFDTREVHTSTPLKESKWWRLAGVERDDIITSSHFSLIGNQGVSVSPTFSRDRKLRCRSTLNRCLDPPSPLGFTPWKQHIGRTSPSKAEGGLREEQQRRCQDWTRLYKCLDEADSYARTLSLGLSKLPYRTEL